MLTLGLPWQVPTTHEEGFRSVLFLRSPGESPGGALIEQELRESLLCISGSSPSALEWHTSCNILANERARVTHVVVLLSVALLEEGSEGLANLHRIISLGLPIQSVFTHANVFHRFPLEYFAKCRLCTEFQFQPLLFVRYLYSSAASTCKDQGVAWDFGTFYSGPANEVRFQFVSILCLQLMTVN